MVPETKVLKASCPTGIQPVGHLEQPIRDWLKGLFGGDPERITCAIWRLSLPGTSIEQMRAFRTKKARRHEPAGRECQKHDEGFEFSS